MEKKGLARIREMVNDSKEKIRKSVFPGATVMEKDMKSSAEVIRCEQIVNRFAKARATTAVTSR